MTITTLSPGSVTHAAGSDRLLAVAAGGAMVMLSPDLEPNGEVAPPPGKIRRLVVHDDVVFAVADDRLHRRGSGWEEISFAQPVVDAALWREHLVVVFEGGIATARCPELQPWDRAALPSRCDAVHAAGDALVLTGPSMLAILDEPPASGLRWVTDRFPRPVSAVLTADTLFVVDQIDGLVTVHGAGRTYAEAVVHPRIRSPYAVAAYGVDRVLVLADSGAVVVAASGAVAEVDVPLCSGVCVAGATTVLFGPRHVTRLAPVTRTRRFPGFVWDVDSRADIVAWATADGVTVQVRGEQRQVTIEGGGCAVRVTEHAVWVAGRQGVWVVSDDGARHVVEWSAQEPAALDVDTARQLLTCASGSELAVYDISSSARLVSRREVGVYAQQLRSCAGETWAACGDGGSLRCDPPSDEWHSEPGIDYVSDVSVTPASVAYATSNGLLLRSRSTGVLRRVLQRPDTSAVAAAPDASLLTTSGATLYTLDSVGVRRSISRGLPFAPRRIVCTGDHAHLAGAGGVIAVPRG